MTDDHYLDLCTKYNFNCIGRLIKRLINKGFKDNG
jgi:hypothetical protein